MDWGRGPAQHEHVVGEYPEELTFSVAEVSVDNTEMLRCIGQRLSAWKAVKRVSLPLLVRLSSTTGATNPVPGYGKVIPLQSASDAVQCAFDLEFASQREWNKVAVEKMIQRFQARPGDTGSAPVKIGVISVRIQYLTEHMRKNRKDKSCLRTLLKLIHRRRKLLRHLQRTDTDSYQLLLQELSLKAPTTDKYSKRAKK